MAVDDAGVYRLLGALEKAAAGCKDDGGRGPPAGVNESSNAADKLIVQLKEGNTKIKDLTAKLQKSELRFDRLQTVFITLRHKLQAANKELEILKDPAVSQFVEFFRRNLETLLAVIQIILYVKMLHFIVISRPLHRATSGFNTLSIPVVTPVSAYLLCKYFNFWNTVATVYIFGLM